MSYKELISVMTPKDKSGFISFLEARNKRKTNRSVALFRSWIDDEPNRLRSKLSDNAFNVLKKRTSDLLLQYIAQSSLNSSDPIEWNVYQNLFMAKRLLSNNPNRLGFKLLAKAEKEALKHHRYRLLNEVYQTAIEYSYHSLSEEQEALFIKTDQNKRQIEHEEQLNMLYAKIKRSFYKAEFNQEKIDFQLLVNNPIDDLQSSFPEVVITFASLFKIVQMFDYYAAQLRNYHEIDSFVEEQWSRTVKAHIENNYDVYYKLETLYALANINFRKKNFIKSLEYLKLLENELADHKKQYLIKYQIRYTTLKALNLHFIEESEMANELLESLIIGGKYEKKNLYSAILTQSMISFHREDFKSTARLLAQLNFSDSWYEKTVGIDWNLHKKYMEILLHVELGNIDLVESRINSMRRKYKSQLENDRNSQALPFLRLIQTYVNDPQIVITIDFSEKVENTIEWKQREEEDIFFICFYGWLKSKMNGTPLFDTTLDLLKKGRIQS